MRERARCDRTGHSLSVVIFSPREDELVQSTGDRIVTFLECRLRCTDEIGRWTDQELCVVLPHTNASGARAFADIVCADFPEDVPYPHCTIYSYPSTDVGEGSDDSEGSEVVNAAPSSAEPALPLETLLAASLPGWKRALDIALSGVGLVVLLPLFTLIALAIKLTSRGPVFFRQYRSGHGGKPFALYKFRTMVINAEALKEELLPLNEQDGAAFKMKDDPRVTRLGRILRTTSLDELPQLWNILRGDMTLVGPRPLPCDETAACHGWQRRRLLVRPGLTCIWQVRGRGTVPFVEWIRMDLEYIRAQSLLHDLKLLVLTVPAVLLRRGAH